MMEEDRWVRVYHTADPIENGILVSVLQDHGIEVVSMNKQDSAYVSIGDIELLVQSKDVEAAQRLIQETKENDDLP